MRFALSAFLLAGLALSLRAADLTTEVVARYGDLKVLRVDYGGKFRTARAELATITSLRKGEKLSEVDPDAVAQGLERTGLYSKVAIGYELVDGGVVIRIDLTEKWTLIPLPFAAYSGQSLTLGLMFMDSDFLGSMSTLVSGGFWTSNGWVANLAYFKRRIGASGLSLGLFALGGNEQQKAAYADGSLYSSYTQDFAGGGFILNFLAGQALRPFIDTRLTWSQPDAADAAGQGLAAESLYLAPELGLSYDGLHVEGWFRSGVKAKLTLKLGIPADGGTNYLFGGLGTDLILRIFGDTALGFGASAGYGHEPNPQRERLGGPGYRTLPFGETFSTQYGAAYSSCEAPIARLGWGVLTLAAFYEAGVYEVGPDGGGRVQVFHGPGGGFRLYLRNIAFPALGVDFAYNIPFRVPEFSASLGIAM